MGLTLEERLRGLDQWVSEQTGIRPSGFHCDLHMLLAGAFFGMTVQGVPLPELESRVASVIL